MQLQLVVAVLVEDLELKEVMVLHLYSRLLLQPAAVVVAVV
jgi:hypothetical protein